MKRPIRRMLTPGERANLRATLREHQIQSMTPELMMNGDQVSWVPGKSNASNPQIATIEARRLKQILDEGSAPDLTKSERRESDKEIRKLEEEIAGRLVPRHLYEMKDDATPAYRNVVNELVKQGSDKTLSAKIERLKNLKRERDPDNPEAGNIETLRKD